MHTRRTSPLLSALLPLAVALALALGGGLHAAAQGTPDEETPAQETVCDGEQGAAYGLCVAYCEAMDCDSANPRASNRACDRVLGNYEGVTGGGVPPCINACGDIGKPFPPVRCEFPVVVGRCESQTFCEAGTDPDGRTTAICTDACGRAGCDTKEDFARCEAAKGQCLGGLCLQLQAEGRCFEDDGTAFEVGLYGCVELP